MQLSQDYRTELGGNPLRQIPSELREELARFVTRQSRVNPMLCRVSDSKSTYGKATAQQTVFDFANHVVAKLDFPFDIKNFLMKGVTVRVKKYGFKRAFNFVTSRSAEVATALNALPVHFNQIDTEYKRVRLADKLTSLSRLHLNKALEAGNSPLEALQAINDATGLALWIPHFLPKAGNDDSVYFSILARTDDDAVWLRAINSKVTRVFETARRAAGMVSPSVSPYASYSSRQWLKDRQRKQTEWLEMMTIESECGESLNLKDVHDASTSNPANRRNELMTRIAGCQEYADANEHVALFVTMTAPGRYHRLKKHGQYFVENKNWAGYAPVDAHNWLSRSWVRFRAAADRNDFLYYGLRVVEPHVDGTPHWHCVFFMPLSSVAGFSEQLSHYQCQFDADELRHQDGTINHSAVNARIKIELIDSDKGDAVAYIAKYISKNIDAHKLDGLKDTDSKKVDLQESVQNVTAWSRTFGFRQFQFQKTPSVTVWRELRRMTNKLQDSAFERIRCAADSGFFSAYFDYMGGHTIKQSDRPVKACYEEKENKYQEMVKKISGVNGLTVSGELLTLLTHEKQWSLVKKEETKPSPAVLSLGTAESGGSRFPWTRVNNCTQDQKRSLLVSDEDYLKWYFAPSRGDEPNIKSWESIRPTR